MLLRESVQFVHIARLAGNMNWDYRPGAGSKLFLGIRDVAFVLRSELDELIERLSFEKDRLEKDEAIYGMTDCDAEMKFYGREVSRVINVLRTALKDLHHLREDYKIEE